MRQAIERQRQLGCDLNYDKLHVLTENHRTLRTIMEVGEFDETHFSWTRIRDNVCLRQPTTIEEIDQLIAAAGHTLAFNAAKTMRADSFVVETNIHYHTDNSLIVDGTRKVSELSEPTVMNWAWNATWPWASWDATCTPSVVG